jgi:hypothetical protein
MQGGEMWQRLWQWIDSAMDAVIWGWDMLMMYGAALFLIPFCLIASLRLLGVDTVWTALEPLGLEDGWLALLMLGAPVWLAVTLCARFSAAPWAVQFTARVERLKWAVIWTSCAGMGTFGVLALLFDR